MDVVRLFPIMINCAEIHDIHAIHVRVKILLNKYD